MENKVLHGFPLALVHPQAFCTNAVHTSTSLSISLGGCVSLPAVTGHEVVGVVTLGEDDVTEAADGDKQ